MTDEVEAVARAICCKSDCNSIATYADTAGCGCVQWRDEAEAAIAALTALGWQKVPAGSVVVPVEPSGSMVAAGELAIDGAISEGVDSFIKDVSLWALEAYRGMIAARPDAGKE